MLINSIEVQARGLSDATIKPKRKKKPGRINPMATRTITVDDLSGKETLTAKPYTIQLTGPGKDDKGKDVEMTIEATFDLSVDSVNALTEWLKDGDTRSMSMLIPRRVKVTNNGDSESEAVRAWAKAQPEFADKIKDKGRLPDDVTDAYKKAHQTPADEKDDSK